MVNDFFTLNGHKFWYFLQNSVKMVNLQSFPLAFALFTNFKASKLGVLQLYSHKTVIIFVFTSLNLQILWPWKFAKIHKTTVDKLLRCTECHSVKCRHAQCLCVLVEGIQNGFYSNGLIMQFHNALPQQRF